MTGQSRGSLEQAREHRSVFGEVLAEIMAARGRKTDDDAIIQLGEEAGLDPRDDAGGFNIRALLDLARSDDARRPGSIPREVSDVLGLSGAERQRLGYAYAYARRHPEHRDAGAGGGCAVSAAGRRDETVPAF